MIEVETCNGSRLSVLDNSEAVFYARTVDQYKDQIDIVEASDNNDLHHLVTAEMMINRLQNALTSRIDFDGDEMSAARQRQFTEEVKLHSVTVEKLKATLGLSRSSRQDDKEDGARFISDVLERARHFGIMRNDQAVTAITMINEIMAVAGTFLRSNEQERIVEGYTKAEEVLQWIDGEVRSRYEEVDKDFIEKHQRYWVGKN